MAFTIHVLTAEEFADMLHLSVEVREDGTPRGTFSFKYPAEFTNNEIKERVKKDIRRSFPVKTADRASLVGEVV